MTKRPGRPGSIMIVIRVKTDGSVSGSQIASSIHFFWAPIFFVWNWSCTRCQLEALGWNTTVTSKGETVVSPRCWIPRNANGWGSQIKLFGIYEDDIDRKATSCREVFIFEFFSGCWHERKKNQVSQNRRGRKHQWFERHWLQLSIHFVQSIRSTKKTTQNPLHKFSAHSHRRAPSSDFQVWKHESITKQNQRSNRWHTLQATMRYSVPHCYLRTERFKLAFKTSTWQILQVTVLWCFWLCLRSVIFQKEVLRNNRTRYRTYH